jgi:O-antigen/teichoic acid export membrane protein
MLRKNILANYLSQGYVTVIGICLVPVYMKYLGQEAYGLISFFAMLQTWFNLLDLGLTPTLARETSRFHAGASSAGEYRRLVRSLEMLFLLVALLGGGAIYLSAGYISSQWLHVQSLNLTEVRYCVEYMALIIAMRWMCGLYRGAITGAEQLVWLGGYNAVIATLRYVGVIPFILLDRSLLVFFVFQLAMALIELAGLKWKFNGRVPAAVRSATERWSLTPLKAVFRFSASIAFTSSVWVIVTQTDKLVLSKILALADYGYFSVAVLVAGGVLMVGGPIGSAVMPRLASLEAAGNHADLIRVYRQATQMVAVVSGGACVTLALLAEPILWAWTGDRALAHVAAPILALYALGNGIVAVAGMPYLLQYAKGDLRLHLIGNAVFVTLLIPIIVLVASQYGGVGAGYVWLGMNMLALVAWIPWVHRKYGANLNRQWYFRDVLLIYMVMAAVGFLLYSAIPWSETRLLLVLEIVIFGALIVLAGFMVSDYAKARLFPSLYKAG